jgi:gamma-glutamylputrescine oxidase
MRSSVSGTYYDSDAVARPRRPQLAAELDCEIVVVGGGLAGLWTALELARRGRDVVVVEAGRIGEGASGRSAGVVSPGYAADPADIAVRVGDRHARALWQLSLQGVAAVRELIADTAMPGVDAGAGRLVAFRTAGEDAAERLAGRLARWGSRAELWRRPQVHAALDTARYHAAVSLPDGFHLNPLNFVLGLAQAAEAAGARIFEASPVVEVDLDGVRKLVATPSGRLRTAEVVVCGSAGVGRAFPQLGACILPVARRAGVTAPLGGRLAEVVRYAGAVSDDRRGGDTFRVIGDRLLWSGGLAALAGRQGALPRRVVAGIAEVFPGLAGVEISHAWSTVTGAAVHAMPQVGKLGAGLWMSSAFAGHGLAPAAIAGQLVASALLDGDDRWRLFVPFGLAPAGVIGRVAVQVGLWAGQLRDRRAEAALSRAGQRPAAAATAVEAEPPAEPGQPVAVSAPPGG